jgi:uncharacterized membrane protein
MRTPAQIAGHPIHPMLVPIPIGLWIFSLVCDFIARGSANPETWAAASLYAMVGGIIGALAAALPGLVDLLSIRHTPIAPTAVKHMALNLTIVVLYIINAYMRWGDTATAAAGAPLVLSIVAILMLLVSGWLGGKMVYEGGVAVHTEEMGSAAANERWGTDRAGSSGLTRTPGMRSDHAFASDAERARERERRGEERPSAGGAGENPRK